MGFETCNKLEDNTKIAIPVSMCLIMVVYTYLTCLSRVSLEYMTPLFPVVSLALIISILDTGLCMCAYVYQYTHWMLRVRKK